MVALAKQIETGETGPTRRAATFVRSLRWDALDEEVRHYAHRHLLDTVGVMVAGATGEITNQAEAVLDAVRPPGRIVVPGRARRADVLDAAYLAGTSAHGIELDDGYRQGSVHPAACVIPAALYAAYGRGIGGQQLLEAVVAGYEVMCAIAFSSHPAIRRRGFHPTSVVGVFGAAAATGRLLDLDERAMQSAFGLAASAAAGLFAFIGGGTDVKRLHAGHAAREGLQAGLLAARGVVGPPAVLEGRDGFFQSFASSSDAPPRLTLPPETAFRITDCYIKPYACCRHLQPSVEALIGLLDRENIREDEILRVQVETYGISAEHAHTGWDEFASAQLSFPYIMALGMRFRAIRVEHFSDEVRQAPSMAALCALVEVKAAPDLDAQYPDLRPARVSVTTDRGVFHAAAEEALGSRQLPLDDAGLGRKFIELTEPVLGRDRSQALLNRLWRLDQERDVTSLVDGLGL